VRIVEAKATGMRLFKGLVETIFLSLIIDFLIKLIVA
jgi:hypothetical protein